MHWMDWFGGGWVMMAFWWILIIAVIYLVVRGLSGRDSSAPREDSSLEILKKRYARGEISKEEFEETKRSLT